MRGLSAVLSGFTRLVPSAVARGAHWGLLDQALSSGTNFAVAFVVVRRVDAAEFGAFSLVSVLYVIAVGAMSAANTQPAVIVAGGDGDALRRSAPPAVGFALLGGALLGAVSLVAGVLVDGLLGSLLMILGLCLPLLLVQDAGRGLCFALGRARTAAANDGAWAAGSLGVIALVVLLADARPSGLTAAWLGIGALAGLLLLRQLRVAPAINGTGRWKRDHVQLSAQLLAAYACTAAPSYLLFALTPLVSGLADLGSARAAYLPFAAFGVLLQSVPLLLLPALSGRSLTAVRRICRQVAVVLVAATALWGVLVALVPRSLGIWVLGEQWSTTGDLRAVFACAFVFQAAGTSALVGLSATFPARLLRVRLWSAPLCLAAGLGLSAVLGATGIALGILVGDVLTTALAWHGVRRLMRAQVRR